MRAFDVFDFKHIEWLNLEIFADPPKGRRRTLDLVAKVRAREKARTAVWKG